MAVLYDANRELLRGHTDDDVLAHVNVSVLTECNRIRPLAPVWRYQISVICPERVADAPLCTTIVSDPATSTSTSWV